jgi:histidine ammonia-lyase
MNKKTQKTKGAKNTVILTGNDLTPDEIYRITEDPKIQVVLSPKSLIKVRQSKKFLDKKVATTVIYGITTGFGPMASHIIGKNQLHELQYNLVRSHAVGLGDPIEDRFVLAAMVVRLNTLVKGYSGVSEDLIEQLAFFINKRILPVIPEHGSVGTSGDLVQLAHIAITLIGEGEVVFEGKRENTANVLKRLKRKPHTLEPKEGLALINGTSVMSGIAALIVDDTERLLSVISRSSALALELINGLNDALSAELHALRPHDGQKKIASTLRKLLASSTLLHDRKQLQSRVNVIDNVYVTPEHIQDVYSFRCVAQILGPALDIYKKTKKDVEIEINSVTDNPIIDVKKQIFLHGGNFHGDYIATAVDQLKISIVKMTILSERRINFFLNRNVNQFFPPFLNLNQPGLTLALQGLQFVATSTTAQSQSLAFPHSTHSISTNADNQDVVSMGTDAALITSKAIKNAYTVLSVEYATLAQAVDHLNVSNKLSPASKLLFKKTRGIVPKIVEDRTLTKELTKLINMLEKDDDLILSFEGN